jgi:KipI family sensor histidine kinase inhibitor
MEMTVPDCAPSRFPRIAAAGDRALVMELNDEIDEQTNRQVVALAENLASSPIVGVIETVPTYRSLLVGYDPMLVRGRELSVLLLKRLAAVNSARTEGRRITVPVLYGGDAGVDLDALADLKGISPQELVEIHSSARYRVYMIGFAPGFAYLGGLPERLHTPRLATPRQRVEAGVIGIGGKQASINSVAGPSGWRFIGRTPLRTFDPLRSQPFVLRAGDEVRFRPITRDEAAELDAAARTGNLRPEWEGA